MSRIKVLIFVTVSLYMISENDRGSTRGKKRPFETPSAVDFYDSMEEEEQDDETKGIR